MANTNTPVIDPHAPRFPPFRRRRKAQAAAAPELTFEQWCDAWCAELEREIAERAAANELAADALVALEAELRTSGSEASELVRLAARERLAPLKVATRLVCLLLDRRAAERELSPAAVQAAQDHAQAPAAVAPAPLRPHAMMDDLREHAGAREVEAVIAELQAGGALAELAGRLAHLDRGELARQLVIRHRIWTRAGRSAAGATYPEAGR